jgi:hypothetical protein
MRSNAVTGPRPSYARAAKLDPGMRIETFSSETGVVFDRNL